MGAFNKYGFFRFSDPGPEGSEGPREAPRSHMWAFPGGSGGLPEAPGTSDKPKQKH